MKKFFRVLVGCVGGLGGSIVGAEGSASVLCWTARVLVEDVRLWVGGASSVVGVGMRLLLGDTRVWLGDARSRVGITRETWCSLALNCFISLFLCFARCRALSSTVSLFVSLSAVPSTSLIRGRWDETRGPFLSTRDESKLPKLRGRL